MSFSFVLGRSGSGKSTYIFEKITEEAAKNPEKRYLVVVPDQFTMQTQMDLVRMSPQGGIMNIEVLSFSRLAYRVFEETGGNRVPVLDDTGKNLILRRCAAQVKDEIPYLAGKIDKPGYIHEVKSAISEFMQYDIDSKGLDELIEYAKDNNRKSLSGKLKDLAVIYDSFKNYICNQYITTEESLDILAKEIYKSKIVKDSIVVLDGFTGFTPIQNRVIGALMDVCDRVIMTLTLEVERALTEPVSEQDLFSFTYKTLTSINRLAKEHNCAVTEPVKLYDSVRYSEADDLSYMERMLYRFPITPASDFKGNINIYACNNIREEVENLALNLRNLVREQEICYRDIAVITGNLSAYSSEIQEKFADMDIPVYIDETKGLVLNPFVEYLRAVLNIYQNNFDYEAVFQYLRTGFSCLNIDEIDLLEKYVTECGIRGHKAYSTTFSRKSRQMRQYDEEYKRAMERGEEVENITLGMISHLNEIRSRFMQELKILEDAGYYKNAKRNASTYIKTLYNFIINGQAISKLKEYESKFAEVGDFSKKKEYSQVYKYTMHIFEQIHNLIGNEEMDIEEFYGILDAGFSEIEIGAIPQSVDRVIVGDMERTRLKPVKYLFFVGLNDGWVPKPGGKGGIISDSDREFLNDSGRELAPSPRQQMYIGRFYMYSIITKPSKGLYLSYSAMDNAATAMRPSYVLEMIKKMFPDITENRYSRALRLPETDREVKEIYSELVRRYADRNISNEEKRMLFILTDVLRTEKEFLENMISNAFFSYEGNLLDSGIATLLYGTKLFASISRIETYAKCAYAYFLKYGMKLRDREEYGIESSDMGNIYHGVLEIFNRLMEENGTDWFDITPQQIEELVGQAVEEEAVRFTDAILFENSKNKYIVSRMKAVMVRTVGTLAYQLRKGDFKPYEYEYSFSSERSLKNLNLGLTKADKLILNGKIDRLDTCEKDDKILVKIVDYKSSDRDFSLVNFYHGVQLQMVVYMNEAIKNISKDNAGKEVIPAAMLYYHIDDPIVGGSEGESYEDIEKKILKALKTKGLVNGEDFVTDSLDNSGDKKSDVIPVERKQDNSYSMNSSVISSLDMKMLGEYADYKIGELAKGMLQGDISTRPIEIVTSSNKVDVDGCAYCKYKGICGFDEHMPGFDRDSHCKMSDEEILEQIRNDLGKNVAGGEVNA